MKRRYFLMSGVIAAVRRRAVAASDRVRVAIVGVRGRGRSLANEFAALAEVDVAWLVDVDQNVLRQVADAFEKRHGKRPRLDGDMRRAFDDNSVDAVVIATPDHWHVPAALLACQAGKDVYVEKPLSHNVREGRMLVEAAKKYGRVVQHGTQGRSSECVRRAIELAQSGAIGNVLMAKAWNVQLRRNLGHKPDSEPPAGVDYDTWVGPAPWLPFNENRFHYNWHWHWNFGTGDAGNDGAHQIDQARWALGVDYPRQVHGMGRKLFFDDDQQTPDTMVVAFNYPDKVLMWEMRIWNPYKMEGIDNGVAIYGSDGMIQIGRWENEQAGFKMFDRAGKLVQSGPRDNSGLAHVRNFLQCVKTRARPNADVETAHLSALHCHLANIVARTGRSIRFDPATEGILGDPESASLLGRTYREHWGTPRRV